MPLGEKLKELRMQKELTQEHIARYIGLKNTSYISDIENNKYAPSEEKLRLWAKALRVSWKEMQDIVVEAELEELGFKDPGFTMMFKDMPRMSPEEKESIIRAYEAVIKSRSRKTHEEER